MGPGVCQAPSVLSGDTWPCPERAGEVLEALGRLLTRCLWLALTRAYKKIEEDDLKFPLIYGEGKKVECGA